MFFSKPSVDELKSWGPGQLFRESFNNSTAEIRALNYGIAKLAIYEEWEEDDSFCICLKVWVDNNGNSRQILDEPLNFWLKATDFTDRQGIFEIYSVGFYGHYRRIDEDSWNLETADVLEGVAILLEYLIDMFPAFIHQLHWGIADTWHLFAETILSFDYEFSSVQLLTLLKDVSREQLEELSRMVPNWELMQMFGKVGRNVKSIFIYSLDNGRMWTVQQLNYGISDLVIRDDRGHLEISVCIGKMNVSRSTFRAGKDRHKRAFHLTISPLRVECKEDRLVCKKWSTWFREKEYNSSHMQLYTEQPIRTISQILDHVFRAFPAFAHNLHFCVELLPINNFSAILKSKMFRSFEALTLFKDITVWTTDYLEALIGKMEKLKRINFEKSAKYFDVSNYPQITEISLDNGNKIGEALFMTLNFQVIIIRKFNVAPENLRKIVNSWAAGRRNLKKMYLIFERPFERLDLFRGKHFKKEEMDTPVVMKNRAGIVGAHVLTDKVFYFET
ncbi:unnamed protein product [Caenorhabditis sp. 36 PRJEB53466]|nr:unnamed protein product [Caenorhabditis sp. 36 PRJEB53466]